MPKIFSKWLLLLVSLHGCVLTAQNDCIDLRDLNAPFIHCTYGVYDNPYAHEGVVPGRHTVITEQGGDPNVGFWHYGTYRYLYMIPPEETYSVRLGDDNVGRRAESIAVDIPVDTNDFDLLILKYAPVLQSPGHYPEMQPRFKFELLDTANNLVDSTCFFADFVADTALGWYASGTPKINLWKDWTSVGIDVSTFHNQTIRVRLTTYDCDVRAHFGYAYFLLKCAKKCIETDVCGDADQYSYSAPEGFNYDWFWRDDPSHSLSHDRSVRVNADGSGRELGCHVSFTENPDCGFDLFTTTSRRFPLAACRALPTDCLNEIQFVNESAVSNDGIHPDGTGNPCDDILWDFGDGHSSSDISPSHSYSEPGHYTVTLVAGLNGFDCSDTARLQITVPEATLIDTVTCEPFLWDGVTYPQSGLYHKNYPTASGCDSLVTLVLDANYNPSFSILGEHWPVGGTELAWSQYTYDIALDNPLCSLDSVSWSVGCPSMSVSPSDNGLSCSLTIFSFLPNNDSVPLRATAFNRCGTEERTLWIHTSYHGTGEHRNASPSLNVFPNPAQGTLSLALSGIEGDAIIQLYDPTGRLVATQNLTLSNDSRTLVLDTSHLPDGLYTLRLSHSTGSISKKTILKK